MCEIIAGPAVGPHAAPVLTSDHPKAIVLDLVQPFAAYLFWLEGTAR